MKRAFVFAVSMLVGAGPVVAGFQRWDAETTKDPFTGGLKVSVSYMDTMRSGAFVICDTSQKGFEVRVLAGWEYVSDLQGFTAEGKIAFDGEVVLTVKGEPGAYGQNIAGVSFELDSAQASTFVGAMKTARSQVAIQDGISNGPLLLSARGSTKAGESLQNCLSGQASPKDEVTSAPESNETESAEGLSPGPRFARFLGTVLAVEMKCKDYQLVAAAAIGEQLTENERKTADSLVDAEQAAASKEITDMSCLQATRKALAYTDLSYDKVWKARE